MEQGINITSDTAPGVTNIGGIVPVKSVKQLMEEQREAANRANSEPVIQNLAAYIKQKWYYSRFSKEMTIEQRMLKSVRQRRGEYDPDLLVQLREQNSSLIYMMLTSNKCRAASSWLRDVLLTDSNDKPWSLKPNPIPEMPPPVLQGLMQQAQQKLMAFMQSGVNPTDQEVRQILLDFKDQAMGELTALAKEDASRMEKKMHSQLLDGQWTTAFAQFIDDLVTFPCAIIKGPVVRSKPHMNWVPVGDTYELRVQNELSLEWERVDPFNIYPAPDATHIDDGYLIERHRLQRADLVGMLGVEGYSDGAIRAVLEEYGKGGLRDWIYVDLTKAAAEGKSTVAAGQNPSELIDALQFWGSVQGQLLRDWGLTEEEVPDPLAEYPIEAWLIGRWIIKAVINPDPLGRKPYYKTSYEEVPGAFWGNSVADLCRDSQSMCNAVARALVNNMSLASGPQVVYNIDRLPQGENITQLFPWKIWQVTSDPLNGNARPVEFFQPDSRASELMAVYEKFAVLADEYTGIPRYMTGGNPSGGAGRTASGMSMLMTNAGKSIKQVIANIDEHVIKPLIDRLYYYNMRYSDDPDLKGDVNIQALGAASLMEKEAIQQRQNEFLGIALNSPIAQQVIGMEGVAELLRQAAKRLDMNTDDIVPPEDVVKRKVMEANAIQQAQMMANQQNGQAQAGGTPPTPGPDQGLLMDGSPQVNRFTPSA
ncbi:MAG: portal protein [Polynucleobacter sp.]